MGDSEISIIGGGWSAGLLDLAQVRGTVIGVNDGAVHAPRVDITVSMDRLWTEWRWPLLKVRAGPTWIRRSAMKNVRGEWDGLRRFECDNESVVFSDDPDTLNGTNSGFCALNLAYQMRPRRIWLFGFDMSRGPKGEPYFFPPYPWAPGGATKDGKYKAWAAQFGDARTKFQAAGIDVTLVGAGKAIQTFRRMNGSDPAWRA